MLPEPGDIVCAGMDLGLRRDSSALAIVHRRGDVLRVAELVELRPQQGAPLKPSHVVRTFAAVMKDHGATYAVGDQHYRESVAEHLEEFGLDFVPGPMQPAEAYVRVRALMREGRVRLPRHDKLLRQLRDTQGIVTSGGRISIQHPRNAGGHSDLVAALVLALYQVAGDETPAVPPEVGSKEWEARLVEQRRQAFLAEQDRPEWMPRVAEDRGEGAWWRR